jgi:hypothetical protein
MLGDELRQAGKKGGVQSPFDARDIKAAVFSERMIAVNEQHRECEGY